MSAESHPPDDFPAQWLPREPLNHRLDDGTWKPRDLSHRGTFTHLSPALRRSSNTPVFALTAIRRVLGSSDPYQVAVELARDPSTGRITLLTATAAEFAKEMGCSTATGRLELDRLERVRLIWVAARPPGRAVHYTLACPAAWALASAHRPPEPLTLPRRSS